MANCAFIDMVTTMNDLFGSNNCPVMFRAEMFSDEEIDDPEKLTSETHPRSKTIHLIPDEEILVNGLSHIGVAKETIFDDQTGTYLNLEDGLLKIYDFLEKLKMSGTFLIGYSVNGLIMKNLNLQFQRVLKKDPVEFKPGQIIDVEKIAKVFWDVRTVGNYAKSTIYRVSYRKEFECDKTKEPVENGILMTRLILDSFRRDIPGGLNLENLSRFMVSEHPVDVFQIGKYKGCEIETVGKNDKQYLSWLVKHKHNFDVDSDMIRVAQDILNREDS